VHANFIENLGDATAADVRAVIHAMSTAVYERFGVALVLEARVIDRHGRLVREVAAAREAAS
jgi:UDP-N-acetylenolpyruvoylglucosamine reductase